MSAASSAHPQHGIPVDPSGEVEGDTSNAEVVGDEGSKGEPVTRSALVYNKQGEVHELEADVVKAVDDFKVPNGYIRKGTREGSFMYSLGVYAEAVEGGSHKYFCLASGACRRSNKVIPCKRGDRSNVNTHHKAAHGLQGKGGAMKVDKKKIARGGTKDSFGEIHNSGAGTTHRVRELLAVRMVVEKCLPFSFFSAGTTWKELADLLTAETTPFPDLSSSRIKHVLVEVFIATKKVLAGNLQKEIQKAVLPIIHYGLDLRTCKVSGRKYLWVHISYVDSNFALQHALLAVKHYCAPSAAVPGSVKKASETLFIIFRSTLAEFGIRLSDLAGGTVDSSSGPELEEMCASILPALHETGWDRCDCRLADKAAEHAFGTPADPRKLKHGDARDVIRLVIETAVKANQSGAFERKFEEAELEMLTETLEVTDRAPWRWLGLARAMERIIRLWWVLGEVYAADGDEFPLDRGSSRDDFLQLYSLLRPLSAITRDGRCGAAPMTAETHMLFAKLKELVLDPEEPLRVFGIPPPAAAAAAAAPGSPEAATQASGAPGGQEVCVGGGALPFSMVPSDQLRPVTIKTREELSKTLVQSLYSRVWDRGAADHPSPYRDATVLLTPPFSSGKYLEALRLTEADGRFLAADKASLAPTTDEEVTGKLAAAWADIQARAVRAAREDHRRSESRDGAAEAAAAAPAGQPLRKRPRVQSSSQSAATPSTCASFAWGVPSVFASFGRSEDGGSSTEEEGEGLDESDEKKLAAVVAAEIERYQAVLMKPKEMDCLNVLTWWRRTGQKMFPYLAPAAQQVFGNQAAVGRVDCDFFSDGYGDLLVPNKSRVDTYWVEISMFLKENFERIPALKDIPAIAAKDARASLPARFHGRDADLMAADTASDVLSNTAYYPIADDIGLEG